MNIEQRIFELEQLAADEGFTLPWPAAVIVAMEAKGHVADLRTGMVVQNGASDSFSLTAAGEMLAVGLAAWGEG